MFQALMFLMKWSFIVAVNPRLHGVAPKKPISAPSTKTRGTALLDCEEFGAAQTGCVTQNRLEYVRFKLQHQRWTACPPLITTTSAFYSHDIPLRRRHFAAGGISSSVVWTSAWKNWRIVVWTFDVPHWDAKGSTLWCLDTILSAERRFKRSNSMSDGLSKWTGLIERLALFMLLTGDHLCLGFSNAASWVYWGLVRCTWAANGAQSHARNRMGSWSAWKGWGGLPNKFNNWTYEGALGGVNHEARWSQFEAPRVPGRKSEIPRKVRRVDDIQLTVLLT